MLEEITPLILTLDEAPNLGRALEKLSWAREIVVVDSFSTDGTPEMLRSCQQVRMLQRAFDTHTDQWNFGLQQVQTPWVLSLDADYLLPDEFEKELRSLAPPREVSAYYARFRYCIYGRPLRASLYPPRAILFRRECCSYVPDGHTQKLQVRGQTAFLRSVIDHDDRKPLADWLRAQDRYATLEAAKLVDTPVNRLSHADRIRRRIFLAPWLVLFHTLLVKGLLFDGWPGLYYVMQRTYAELLLSLRLAEHRLPSGAKSAGGKSMTP